MAIRAADRVTLALLPTPTYVRTYYLVQESTLGEPAAPTTNPPPDPPWKTKEPTYTAGATTTLYTVILNVWGNGYFEYGLVQKSSSYEAAKQAYNAAAASRVLAEGLYQVIPSVIAPTTSPTGALKSGDQWWKIGPTGPTAGKFIGVAVWNGSAWQDRQMVADSILVPGSVGNVLIGDGAIDGEVITGATVRTAASGQRVQLDVVGLRTFNASGVETTKLTADAGGLNLTGSLVSRAGGTGPRASLDSGSLVLDNQDAAGSISLSKDGLSKLGAGVPLYIGHDSAGANSPLRLYASGSSNKVIATHGSGRPAFTPIVAHYTATASIPALSSSPNVGTPVLSTAGYQSAYSSDLFTPGAHSITVAEAGVYEFRMMAAVPAVGTARSFVQIAGPGNTEVTEFGPGTYNLTGGWVSQLAAGDTVTFCAYQSTGAARTAPTYIKAIYHGPRT